MSVAESFLNTAKDMLMMTENIKRLDSHIDRLATEMSGLDRRLMRIEIMIELSKPTTAAPRESVPRKRGHKELP